MAVSMQKARDFVYQNGTLWERALYAYLFQGDSAERFRHCLLVYQNVDSGYGHALEPDIRCPDSHPLALEFLLYVLRCVGIAPGELLKGTARWLEGHLEPDGSLRNPTAVLEYPRAPWWQENGQSIPASITGNLIAFEAATPTLRESTRRWAKVNLTEKHIRENEWLFMAYHPFDYYMNEDEFPEVERLRQATIENILACAQKAPDSQAYEFFRFAPQPDSPVAQAAGPELVNRLLDILVNGQQEDGGWRDEHGLPQWYTFTTLRVLYTLRRYGRLHVTSL